MKEKIAYSLIFAVPGLLISLIFSVVSVGLTLAVLWLGVFGDNPWPNWSNIFMGVVFIFSYLISFAFILWLGYKFGTNRFANNLGVNRKHIYMSATLFLILIFFVISKIVNP